MARGARNRIPTHLWNPVFWRTPCDRGDYSQFLNFFSVVFVFSHHYCWLRVPTHEITFTSCFQRDKRRAAISRYNWWKIGGMLVVIRLKIPQSMKISSIWFYPLFEEKVGIVLLSGSEFGLESELSRRFEVPWKRKSHFPSFIYICTEFVIRTSLAVFDRLSWNLDVMCKYGWNCAK